MIVCLGWGSLVWDPRCLPISGEWHNNGPKIPLEFARQSQNGRLTLVIDPESPPTEVLWAALSVADLSEAVEALSCREGTPTDQPIGRWPNDSPYECTDIIEKWAQSRSFDGVVWTALRPKFGDQNGSRPSQGQAVDYLASLRGHRRHCAEEYVRRAPFQIDTPYRQAISKHLRWTPIE